MDLNIGQNKWEEIMSVKDTIKKSVLESGTFAQYVKDHACHDNCPANGMPDLYGI